MPIDVERLRTQCVYESQGPVAVLISDMDEIGRTVEKWKAYRRKIRWVCGGLLLVALICFVAGQVLAGLVALAASIAGFVYAFKYARGAVTHPLRCETMKGLAAVFADDTHPKAPVPAHLSLREQRKLLQESDWTQRRKGKQKFYADSWLTLEAHLLDGTTVAEEITELSRVRTYVNPRGKSKSKTRTRHIVSMRFCYPPAVYGDLRRTGAMLKDPFKLPSAAHVKGLIVTEHDVKVKMRVDRSDEVARSCSMLALGVYRMMNLGRKIAAHQGGAK